jgi:hypothetical protein
MVNRLDPEKAQKKIAEDVRMGIAPNDTMNKYYLGDLPSSGAQMASTVFPSDAEQAEHDAVAKEIARKVAEQDAINPHYYKGFSNNAEVIDIVENLPYNRGAAVKYLARAGNKSIDHEIEDLRKAAWYVQRELDRIKADKK